MIETTPGGALAEVQARLLAMGVRETDLTENFIQASGPGGQKVNKSASCVLLIHRPTGLQVKCQASRYQGQNRVVARRLLLEKLISRQRERQEAEQARREQERRRNRRPSRAAKARMIANKTRQAQKKRLRSRVDLD
jgi:protein subunit release factor B